MCTALIEIANRRTFYTSVAGYILGKNLKNITVTLKIKADLIHMVCSNAFKGQEFSFEVKNNCFMGNAGRSVGVAG